jgi:hypothetical protein
VKRVGAAARRAAALLLFLGLLSGGPAGAQTQRAAPPPLALSRYRALVADARREAERGLDAQRARSLRQRLAGVRQVAEPDGRRTAVDNRTLLDALARAAAGSDAKARKEAAARLRTLDAALTPTRGSGDAASGGDTDARAQALRILQADEFRRADQAAPPKSWLEKQWDALGRWWSRQMAAFGRWLRQLFGGVRGPKMPSNAPNWLAATALFLFRARWVLLGLVVAVLLYFGLRGRRLPVLARRNKKRGEGTGLDLDEDALPDPLGAAREHARAGDYRSALRLAYIASLRRLAGSGLLVLEPNRTNWEYQRTLRGTSRPVYDTLLPATRLFDRVWYGEENATEAEYQRVVAVHDALPASSAEAASAPAATAPAGVAP